MYTVSKKEYIDLQEFLEAEINPYDMEHDYHTRTIGFTSEEVFIVFEKFSCMSNGWSPLTPEEEEALLKAFEERMESYGHREEEIECTCELDSLLRVGCKCGAFKKEQEREEKKQAEIDKKIQEDLKKGVPYEERVKRYGRG